MSYLALARKWRPKSFREMVGQEHVLKALINALDQDRLHHAYLFTGTRGVGKTTIARILAKCLNCEQGVSSEPCGECSSCNEIAEGRSVDLLEVDAASRTKVEDTRELLENVQYAPTRSRYKVYLIDEVHMLSNHSFNALLKTLEEPPPHVKFLLATTDPQKLPATILSRCLQFNLKNMPPEQIVGHLSHILDKEMVTYEEPALWLLGRAAAGSMRDAQSLTDQAIAFGSGALRETDVRSMLGTVDMSFVYQVLEALVVGQPAELLAVVARMGEHAPDFESGLDELVSWLPRVGVAQAVPDAIDNNWGDAERIAQLAIAMTAEDTQLFYQMAINGKRDIPLAADPRSGFEMTVLRMLAFRPAVVFEPGADVPASSPANAAPAAPAVGEVGAAVKKPLEVEAPVTPEPIATAQNPVAESSRQTSVKMTTDPIDTKPKPAPPRIDMAAIESAPRSEPAVREAPVHVRPDPEAGMALAELTPGSWPQLLEQLGLVGIVYNIASNCELHSVVDGALAFVLDQHNATLFNSGHAEKVRLALKNYFDADVSVSIEPGMLQGETPARRSMRLADERQQQAVVAIEADPVLQQIIERFDGELDRDSIAPLDS